MNPSHDEPTSFLTPCCVANKVHSCTAKCSISTMFYKVCAQLDHGNSKEDIHIYIHYIHNVYIYIYIDIYLFKYTYIYIYIYQEIPGYLSTCCAHIKCFKFSGFLFLGS